MVKVMFWAIITFCSISCFGQTPDSMLFHNDIVNVAFFKWEYEKYKSIVHENPIQQNIVKKDSLLQLYVNSIRKLDLNEDLYLKIINHALKNKSVPFGNQSIFYKYVNVNIGLQFDKQRHFINRTDFYKVVKYSVFDKKMDTLPEDFRGLPVIDENNYNGINKFGLGNYKKAVTYISKNLQLSKEEKQFIKSKKNPQAIIDIKRYLDKNGMNKVSTNFIKWAFPYLLKNYSLSLNYLESINQLNQMIEGYKPRDRAP